jgi:hypothetical protein
LVQEPTAVLISDAVTERNSWIPLSHISRTIAVLARVLGLDSGEGSKARYNPRWLLLDIASSPFSVYWYVSWVYDDPPHAGGFRKGKMMSRNMTDNQGGVDDR